MITKEQAFEIAKSVVPGLGKMQFTISSNKPNARIYGTIPDNCWYFCYSKHGNTFISSDGIFIDRENGKVRFHGHLSDEG